MSTCPLYFSLELDTPDCEIMCNRQHHRRSTSHDCSILGNLGKGCVAPWLLRSTTQFDIRYRDRDWVRIVYIVNLQISQLSVDFGENPRPTTTAHRMVIMRALHNGRNDRIKHAAHQWIFIPFPGEAQVRSATLKPLKIKYNKVYFSSILRVDHFLFRFYCYSLSISLGCVFSVPG